MEWQDHRQRNNYPPGQTSRQRTLQDKPSEDYAINPEHRRNSRENGPVGETQSIRSMKERQTKDKEEDPEAQTPLNHLMRLDIHFCSLLSIQNQGLH
jgi:hypothetical protein